MLTLSPADFDEIELVSGCQITCSSCTNTLFIQRKRRNVIADITEGLSQSGWQKAINDNEYFVCVCPKCVNELKENELEQGEA
ncbi:MULTISPECIES: hypothetical protein [Shewanella]|uniref:hypothetical protein n=1 Tax=Shewanella TaxID=22 RepID=UPI002E7BBF83|nr:hypothetical protein [Shewanella oncorhynchi]WVI92734.1 hypothetical protein VR487_18205 [Shewanella oncorhynchi]